VTAVLKDFNELNIYGDRRPYSRKLLSQDKGQKEMVRAFISAIRDGEPSPIAFSELEAVTLATFKILESLQKRQVIKV
jgi:polar amino acid transport system substrate-binding protein